MTLEEFNHVANNALSIWAHVNRPDAPFSNGCIKVTAYAAIEWAELAVKSLNFRPHVMVDKHGALWLGVIPSTGERLDP